MGLGERHVAPCLKTRWRKRCPLRRHQRGTRQDLRKSPVQGCKIKTGRKQDFGKNLFPNVSVCVLPSIYLPFSRGNVCSSCFSAAAGGSWILSVRVCEGRAFLCLRAPHTVLSTGGRQKEECCRLKGENRTDGRSVQTEREREREDWRKGSNRTREHMWCECAEQLRHRQRVPVQTSRGIRK